MKLTKEEARVLFEELGPRTQDEGPATFLTRSQERVYDRLEDAGYLRMVRVPWEGDRVFETTNDGEFAIEGYIGGDRAKRELVGYVVKVGGDEYATGNGAHRSSYKRGAYVFDQGSWSDPKRWAVGHRDRCHPGGRIVARYRRVPA